MFSVHQGLLDLKKQLEELRVSNVSPHGQHFKQIKQKRRLYLLQKGRCCFCKEKTYACFSTSPSKRLAATIEHVIPRTVVRKNLDRYHGVHNKKISCHRCNQARGTMSYEKFSELVEKIPFNLVPVAVKSPRIAAQFGVLL